MTVDEALEHPYLAKFRNKSKEVVAKSDIQLEFDNVDEIEEDALRGFFEEEIKLYY